MAVSQDPSVIEEVLDFLISSPSTEEILAFHVSEAAQNRLRTLLDQNREGTLTAAEKAELEEMSRVDHFFTLVKARATKRLKD